LSPKNANVVIVRHIVPPSQILLRSVNLTELKVDFTCRRKQGIIFLGIVGY